MRNWVLGSLVVIVIGTAGGRLYLSDDPETPIVQEMEAAGAGDISWTDTHALSAWLTQHPALAQRILEQCSTLPPRTASWVDTREGRTCQATVAVTSFAATFRAEN